MDGGPHQTIPAGTTWTPSFFVKNKAGTYLKASLESVSAAAAKALSTNAAKTR